MVKTIRRSFLGIGEVAHQICLECFTPSGSNCSMCSNARKARELELVLPSTDVVYLLSWEERKLNM